MIRPTKNTARHALEEAFARDVDSLLMDRLQTQAESDEAKERLAKATGWNDHKLLSQLASLGITPESLMAVQMVPLVLIAWANHGVDRKEREFVMSKAERFGVRERSEAHAILEHWLRHRPPVTIYDTWRRFIRCELASVPPGSRERLVVLMKNLMFATARCSGGFLGLRRICANEQRLISAMSRVLDDCLKITATNLRAG